MIIVTELRPYYVISHSEMLSDVFTYEIITIIPAECLEFTDYILENYKSENYQFPSSM